MKISVKKLIAILLVLTLQVMTLSIASATSIEEQSVAAPTVDSTALKDANGYDSYKIKYAEKNMAKIAVEVSVNTKVDDSSVKFMAEVMEDGLYTVGMSYKALGNETQALEVGIKVDGKAPFTEANKLYFPRAFKDAEECRVDGLGNEFAPEQKPYEKAYSSLALDITRWSDDPYLLYLTKGVHEVTLTSVTGSFELYSFQFGVPKQADAYKQPTDNSKNYKGEPIVIEAEDTYLKNSYWLSPKSDTGSIDITPNSTVKSLVNYIGGGNWKTSGDTIFWETPELEEGYYVIGFSFRQSAVLGGKTYRKLLVDGEVPFSQAESIGFKYDDGWQQTTFSDKNDNPYLIYLSKGKHTLALTAVPGEMMTVREILKDTVADISAMYLDITMITGETVDTYRDYDLFEQIPDMDKRMQSILNQLNDTVEKLTKITNSKTGAHASVIKNMARTVQLMLENRYTAHRYVSEFYNCYTSLAAVLYEMRDMPLDLDKIILASPQATQLYEKAGIFSKLIFSVKSFFVSFVRDYNNISNTQGKDTLTIWVNWGRDQAQVLNALIQTSFTAKTDIPVNVQLVNASIVQAVLSGKGPDCILQHSRSEPVNLAMRGVLYDLSQFDDLENVLSRFQDGAEKPYYYKNGLYALPDTQNFYLLFYRKDILNQLGLKVPQTWDDFKEVAKLLMRQNLTAWIPNNTATDLNQVNAGIGSLNLFPSLLMQRGLEVYRDDGRSTNLSDAHAMLVFAEWTDYYTLLKLPKTMDFYNRFRTGTCPLGISNLATYTTLKTMAPEIDGQWSVAQIPGTELADGSISRVSSGGGTSCAMLKSTKNPQNAWEFLKWWTDAETQLSYSNEVEALLGPAGRVSVSNVEAFKSLSWDAEMIEPILKAWDNVVEIPEYPGSYYVSRSVYQSFWNVVNENENPKDMLLKYSQEADKEIQRKWEQYEARGTK